MRYDDVWQRVSGQDVSEQWAARRAEVRRGGGGGMLCWLLLVAAGCWAGVRTRVRPAAQIWGGGSYGQWPHQLPSPDMAAMVDGVQNGETNTRRRYLLLKVPLH